MTGPPLKSVGNWWVVRHRVPVIRTRVFHISMLLIGLALPPPAAAQSATAEHERIVDGLNRWLAQTEDLSAEFVQFVHNRLNQPTQQRGHVYLDSSGKMRWEYDSPVVRYYVVDGDILIDYLPGENLLRRSRADEELLEQMPLMDLLGRKNLRDEFTSYLFPLETEMARLEGTRVLRLIPERETEVEEIILEVDPGNFNIRRFLMNYRAGDPTEFVFDDIRVNSGLSDGLWEIIPAPDTDVVDTVN